jgi:hypothetical protein
VTYELWETASGNLVGTYDTENAALAVVRHAIGRHGRAYVDSLALGREDLRGRSTAIASGAELADRALAELPTAAG